jgi:5'-3' exonuclease
MASSITEWQAEQIKDFRQMLLECENIPQLVSVARNLVHFVSQAWYLRGCLPAYNKRLADFLEGRKERIVVVIDFKAICHLAYHRAKDTSPASEFADIISRIKMAFSMSSLFLFADEMEEESWRYAKDSRWKSSRLDITSGFLSFVASAREALDKRGVKRYMFPTYDADDVLASLSTSYALAGDKCVMVCQDKDLYQCLGPKVNMYWKGQFFNRESLFKNYACEPKQWVDWLAMVGRNDIPGASGVGEKTASKLLITFGSYINCLNAIDQVKNQFSEKVAAGLMEFEKAYFDTHRLHRLNQTLDVEVLV